jgi:nucleoid-associated protein Lsr2
MARQYVEQLTDDLDGGKADSTIRFSWENTTYEVDLSKKNAAAFAKLVKPYIDAGRKVRRGTATTARRSSNGRARGHDLSAVRAWAKENGHAVADRGRIPAAVLAAYQSR